MNRPNKFSDEVDIEVAKKLLPKVTSWLNENGDHDNDHEEVLRDIARAVNLGHDGYNIARDLHRSGWCPDANLVDILDDVDFYRRAITEKMEEAWVAENKLTGPTEGTTVSWPKSPSHLSGLSGQVQRNTACGRSYVSFTTQTTTNAPVVYIIPWEDLKSYEDVPA